MKTEVDYTYSTITNEFATSHFKNNRLHREDGPAIECANGYKEWFLNGKKCSKKEHNRIMNEFPVA